MKKVLLFSVALYACAYVGIAIAESGLGDASMGKRLYSQRCAVCHGQDGRGRNGMAPNFFEEWHRLTKTDDELAENIRNDYSSPDGFYDAGSCPPHTLTDEDMDDVLAYLRQLTGPRLDDPFASDPFDEPMDSDPFDKPVEFR